MSKEWLLTLHEKLSHRNETQWMKYKHIYEEYHRVFQEHILQEAQHTSLKHKFVLLEHAVAELTQKEDYLQAISTVKSFLTSMQMDLFNGSGRGDSLHAVLDLHRVVYDQRKRIKDLQDENILAKEEYKHALDQIADLRAEVETLNQKGDQSTSQQRNQQQALETSESEVKS
eukprot:gene392-427_t